jgi:hypothetical protein
MEEMTNKEAPAPKEGAPLEREIFELEEKLAEKKKELEKGYAPKERLESRPAVPSLQAVRQKPTAPTPPAGGKAGIMEKNPKVKALVDMAFHDGISKAVEEAKKTGDAYLIDAFHDALMDEVYDMLLKEGLLKEM